MNIRMSSKIGRFFYLTISFVLGIFFLATGIYSVSLPWWTLLQNKTIQFIQENTLIFSLFGLGFILIGLSVLVYAILNSRRRYIYIRTGKHAITVNESLVHQYLETYWQEKFPTHHIPSHLTIKKEAIAIVVDFPFLPAPEQEDFLAQAKKDLQDIFGRLLGYPHDIQLAASFQPEPPPK